MTKASTPRVHRDKSNWNLAMKKARGTASSPKSSWDREMKRARSSA